jgi:hypothetical protein
MTNGQNQQDRSLKMRSKQLLSSLWHDAAAAELLRAGHLRGADQTLQIVERNASFSSLADVNEVQACKNSISQIYHECLRSLGVE